MRLLTFKKDKIKTSCSLALAALQELSSQAWLSLAPWTLRNVLCGGAALEPAESEPAHSGWAPAVCQAPARLSVSWPVTGALQPHCCSSHARVWGTHCASTGGRGCQLGPGQARSRQRMHVG